MYRKILFLFIGIMITAFIFISCSDDSSTSPEPTPKCKIVSPNGGEIVQRGQVVKILFDNELTDSVAIRLYKNGEFLEDIESLVTTNDSLEWLVPNYLQVGTDYQVMITSIEDEAKYDMSDGFFTIAPAGDYIIVTSSNGGDIWLKGATKQITWYDNIAGGVNIFLIKNGVPVMDIFGTPQASSGTKSWTIPTTLDDAADYSIQIVSVDNPAVNDISDHFFCIANSDNIQNIIGDWNVNYTYKKGLFSADFYTDHTWKLVEGTDTTTGTWNMIGNGLRFDFDEASAYYLGVVEGNEMEGTMKGVYGNEGVWEADRVIPALLTPNGGQVWMRGTTQTITWDTAIAGNVVLSLADSTGVVQNIATVLGSLGTYDWAIPSNVVPGAAYLIRIAKEINPSAMDESDHYICISADVTVDITGDWKIYSTVTKWSAIWTFNSNYTWTNTEALSGTWQMSGNGLRWDYDAYSTYYIGNIGIDVGTGTSLSNTMGWNAERILEVLTPNGGEFIQTSEVVNITWSDNLTSDFVKIDLYENDTFLRTIAASTINDNDHPWTVPADLVTSTKYKIRITSATSDIYDESDAYFTISGVPATPATEDETFNDGLAQNWSVVNGTWTLADSLYQSERNTTNTSTSYFNTPVTGNYMVETNCRKVAGDYYYGLIINGDHTAIGTQDMWNSYQFFIDLGTNRFYFAYYNNGSWMSAYSGSSTAINAGLNQWNKLKVIADNGTNNYHLFINDEYIGTTANTLYNQGEIGLLDFSITASETEFDYVKISPVNKSAMDGIKIKRLDKQEPVILGSSK